MAFDFARYLKTLRRYREIHGRLGTARHLLRRLVRAARAAAQPIAGIPRSAFDRLHDVDTDGEVAPWNLDTSSPSYVFSTRYQAVSAESFDRAMAALSVRFEDFAFVDFGSGKGRALLLAARFPFRAVKGVELSPSLHAVAERNIEGRPSALRRCEDVRSFCGDALTFPLPPLPCVFFLFNPFDPGILEPLITRMSESFDAQPRPMAVVYVNPEWRALFDSSPRFKVVVSGDDYAVFTTTDG